MPRSRSGILALGLLAVIACGPRQPSPSASSAATSDTGGLRLIPMDSATAERLCVKPDLVRAGLADCVLKDQSPPVRPIPRPLPPP